MKNIEETYWCLKCYDFTVHLVAYVNKAKNKCSYKCTKCKIKSY